MNPIPAHSLAPTPYLSRVTRVLKVALHLLRAMLTAALFYQRMGTHRQLAFKQRWSQQLLKILEIRLEAGVTDAPHGCLIVANHISWLDIFVINALRPASFVAKAEVRAWPLIGWLAARNDTIFVNRGSRQHARQVNVEIDTRLNSGFDVAVFPEGRTTDGARLLEFHAALLQSAIETGRPILPMAIAYRDANGQPSLAPSFAETTLPQCFAAILACRSLSARLMPLPPVVTTGQSRRDVARAAHDAIATRLGFLRPNRTPETPPDLPA
ncbi:1-acyl-sn-glycerol-3-phosphate acyltransferase [Betaproteobacteria bacterium]|nr:1-acyl-sn-glycerol-3-phosphate acyltransferase [Betaproteobacteria bacterium]